MSKYHGNELEAFNKPVETYALFYWRVFGGYKPINFLYKIKDDFNRMDKFLN